MIDSKILLSNINKIHTTKMGMERIRRNLSLGVDNVVEWCKSKIMDKNSLITIKGKNWYIEIDKTIITVNKYSYTIITAHKL